ncbi:hypothetical protein [Rheinheimera sp. MMS21-TC3]|uniref:hypothetical protein n=1 Tax=Rheinheimera sp. MMS21-TC3 TaxID=3072790 RepID=UPI0028C385C5|nr:hypothetical protein [Rheinheimera sp. MMS21-TC3]WNO59480.1 hypothetical protein RDV63_00495 [Rheinheimera sp. MMS21-TC3]
MDLFLLGTVMFLLANVAVVIKMLRRVNLHNDSVLAWEQAQLTPVATPVLQYPVALAPLQPQTVFLAEAA